jgi:EAL domain-containing protein (putative c-di-GMP-specific phosphodiesterase class I)/CHASE2 domain-containing sensor protein
LLPRIKDKETGRPPFSAGKIHFGWVLLTFPCHQGLMARRQSAEQNLTRGKGGGFRLRVLVWTFFVSLLFGAAGLGEPLEDALRMGRNLLHKDAASGQIVIVAVDDPSLSVLGRWPWPRRHMAALTDSLRVQGARQILFDLDFSAKTDPRDDEAFAQALAKLDMQATLASRFSIDPVSGGRSDMSPIPSLHRHADVANINVRYNYAGAVWRVPYELKMSQGHLPSFAAKLSGKSGSGEFLVDYSIQPASVPVISAIDVIRGTPGATRLRGKDVIVATTATQLGDIHFLPGHGPMPGVYIHALGAETLRSGTPAQLGWLLPLVIATFGAALCLHTPSRRLSAAVLLLSLAALLGTPVPLEHRLISVDVVPALVMLLGSYGAFAWIRFRKVYRLKALTNPLSGLPNLQALREDSSRRSQTLIAARVHNYAQISATLAAEEERALIQQIVNRFSIAKSGEQIFHGEEGVFAWFAPEGDEQSVEGQLHALHALFRNGVSIGSSSVDLSVVFGFDGSFERPISKRVASALVAAEEAAQEGQRFKKYDPAHLTDASWKISLLSQLDEAIDSGDLWVAYQPKLDLRTNRICGAEALVRWTHPERGVIEPKDFIPAAEQSNRIERLTISVLERAINAAAAINAQGAKFDIAVNLSARLIDHPGLGEIIAGLLYMHGLDPQRLTLEVTETAAITSSDFDTSMLDNLRQLGVNISIDDYGTGQSTLDYLKKIPATEIKIDMSFVQGVTTSDSDRIMVRSTIQLAHSLGQKVVAEGVEDQQTLSALAAMECDMAQGYFIGRPMKLEALTADLLDRSGADSEAGSVLRAQAGKPIF